MKYARRYGGGEPKSFHAAFSESTNHLNGCDDNEIITESLTLETETEKRHRLDSFYSAKSAKSTYFSTGSVSSYHSIDDSDSAEIGMLLIVHTPIELITLVLMSPLSYQGAENICSSQIMYGPSSTLPALTTQLSNGWTQIQGRRIDEKRKKTHIRIRMIHKYADAHKNNSKFGINNISIKVYFRKILSYSVFY